MKLNIIIAYKKKEIFKLLRSQMQVAVKVKETMRGLHSVHEIMIQHMQTDGKIKQLPVEEIKYKDGAKYVSFSYIEVQGVKAMGYRPNISG